MALDSSNVRVAVTGALSVAPVDTPIPADGDDALDAAAADLGYFNEDGVTETRNRTTNTIRGWQNGAILREVVTESSLTYQGVLVETKREVVELYYGNTVNATTGGIPIVPARTGGRKWFNLDIIDGDEFIRTTIPEGEVTEVGDQVYQNGEPVGYEVTITAYVTNKIQDADGNDAAAIKFYSSLVVAA